MTNAGKAIQAARESKGVSRWELARQIAVKEETLAKIEATDEPPDAATLSRIAKALGTTKEKLLSG